MAASLYVEESVESWKRTYELYKEILERKADKQKKDKAKKLLELDHWWVLRNSGQFGKWKVDNVNSEQN